MTSTPPVVETRVPAVWRELLASGAVARVLRWQPLAVAAAASVAVMISGIANGGLPTLRVAGLLLALGVAFVIDDASAASTAAAPLSRGYQVAMRVALGGLAVAVGFASIALPKRAVGVSILAGVALEAAALGVVALATCVLAQVRLDEAEPGLFGAAAVGAVIFTMFALYRRVPIMPPAGPDWPAAHLWWAGLLVLGLVVLVVAAREPGVRQGCACRADCHD